MDPLPSPDVANAQDVRRAHDNKGWYIFIPIRKDEDREAWVDSKGQVVLSPPLPPHVPGGVNWEYVEKYSGDAQGLTNAEGWWVLLPDKYNRAGPAVKRPGGGGSAKDGEIHVGAAANPTAKPMTSVTIAASNHTTGSPTNNGLSSRNGLLSPGGPLSKASWPEPPPTGTRQVGSRLVPVSADNTIAWQPEDPKWTPLLGSHTLSAKPTEHSMIKDFKDIGFPPVAPLKSRLLINRPMVPDTMVNRYDFNRPNGEFKDNRINPRYFGLTDAFDPDLCFDFLFKGKCVQGSSCKHRHAPPCSEERWVIIAAGGIRALYNIVKVFIHHHWDLTPEDFPFTYIRPGTQTETPDTLPRMVLEPRKVKVSPGMRRVFQRFDAIFVEQVKRKYLLQTDVWNTSHAEDNSDEEQVKD